MKILRAFILLTIIIGLFFVFLNLRPSGHAQSCTLKGSGDANCDGAVNLIDYELWRREFTNAVTTQLADFNGDNKTDLVDFELWRRGFNTPVMTLTPGSSPTPVPPPPPPPGGYQIPVPPEYPISNNNGTYFTTLKTPDNVVKWRAATQQLWYKPLPDNTPVDPNSAGKVDVYARVARGKALANGNTIFPYASAFTKTQPFVYFVDSDRERFIQVDHTCHVFDVPQPTDINAVYPGKNGIPFPAEGKMPNENLNGDDHPTMIYDYKKDIYFEFWDFITPNLTGTGRASTCLGIATMNFTAGDGMGHPGIMNSGIPRSGAMITLDEAYKLKINHVISVQSFQERGDQPSYPATQYVGVYNCSEPQNYNKIGGIQNCIFDGQRLRLPANYDTSKISHPFARAVAEAIKKYGLIIADYAGCNCIEVEGERTATTNFGYHSPWDDVFAPMENYQVFDQIPWEDLQVLPKDWGKP
jgi:hypothetical protein